MMGKIIDYKKLFIEVELLQKYLLKRGITPTEIKLILLEEFLLIEKFEKDQMRQIKGEDIINSK